MVKPETDIGHAVIALMTACGFAGRGESGTEEFLRLVLDAAREVEKNIKRSHRHGLFWDAQHNFARLLDEAVEQTSDPGLTEELVELTDDDQPVDFGARDNQPRDEALTAYSGPAFRR